MKPNSRKFLAFLLFFFFLLRFSIAHDISFQFQSRTLRNLTLLGDAYLRNGVVGLTRDLGVPTSSSGSLIYNNPITFLDPLSNSIASFSTKFSFSISNVNPTSYGDGLTFFLSPDNRTLGSPGGYLGLVNSSQLTKNKFIAVEFDTKLDTHFSDLNENHVGLDIDSLNSIKTADPMIQGIDLKSGKTITAWIDYDNVKKILNVFLSFSDFQKPLSPVLCVNIDLSGFLSEFMFVGFSASTEGSTELHLIQNWNFHSSGFPPIRPFLKPHNVSVNTVTFPPPIPVSNSENNHHRRLALGFGIAGPTFFFVVLATFGYFTMKKWRGIKNQDSFEAEFVSRPRQFTFKELKAATRGFHSSRIIGRGAFGTVYKAFLFPSGTIAAVKRSKHSSESKTEFIAELTIIARYGVVILEVACGKRPIEKEPNGQNMVHLVDWVWGFYSRGNIVEAADNRLNGEFNEEQMRKLLLVGLSCANPDEMERPSMRRVLQILNDEAEPAAVAKKKPSLTFSNSLPLSIEDIVSDSEEDDTFVEPKISMA
ncbi:Legume lectin domain [Dillenia turbinata]|uniref:non-specific serine/threonine protein kinase n=1 Tax=Dillenia turbinata TaxID=194707 RepID=A0AAN8ZHW4_9MAGN